MDIVLIQKELESVHYPGVVRVIGCESFLELLQVGLGGLATDVRVCVKRLVSTYVMHVRHLY